MGPAESHPLQRNHSARHARRAAVTQDPHALSGAEAFAFIGLQEMFSDWTKHWQLLMGLVIVAAVLFMPTGLAGLPRRIFRTVNWGEDDE